MKTKKAGSKEEYSAHGGTLKELVVGGSSAEAVNERIATMPRLNLSDRQLYDLEMLLNGGFSPLEGFLSEGDYRSVLESMRLDNSTLWPIPIVLDVSDDTELGEGDEVALCDPYGKPLAIMAITSKYKADKEKEAQMVYGTTDKDHFGVRYIFENMHDTYLGGKIEGVSLLENHDFTDLRHTPRELREWFANEGWDKVVAFQTRNPLHRAHYELIQRAASEYDAKALIHPVVGMTKEGDIDYITRVRSYRRLHEAHMSDFAKVSLLPLAMRMAGPREALWHAIIRKNYGATHFIVGRDHAGPGKDASGTPFYGSYDAQDLVKEHEREIGITMIPMKEMVYVEEKKGYQPVDEVASKHTIQNISGTEFRKMIRSDVDIPEWFSFPEVIEELRRGMKREQKDGFTVFLTGLSGAGKSTIARLLFTKLLELSDKKITLLDGDVIRQHLSKGLGFSREDRDTNIERIGFVASEITKHGGIAVCAAIAPYHNSRNKIRRMISEEGTFVEIFVSTSIKVCKERDTKGLYKKAEKGILKGFTGVDDPYEVPEGPEIVIDTEKLDPVESVEKIISYLEEHGLIQK